MRAHVIGLTEGHTCRHHYAWLARMPPLFKRREDGLLDPADRDAPERNGVDVVDLSPEETEFALEAYLEESLLSNWDRIDWGRKLVLWEGDGGATGHQLSTPVGGLDFLCRDEEKNALVVIELKRGLPSDRVVGQTARYIGWVRANLAQPAESVEGIIIAHDSDDRLRYAASAIPGLSLLTYEITFGLREAPRVEKERRNTDKGA